MSDARQKLAADQEQVMEALLHGGHAPAQMDAGALQRTALVLRAKRRRSLVACLPRTCEALGPSLEGLLTEFESESPPLEDGQGLEDARAFLDFLKQRHGLPWRSLGEAQRLGLPVTRWRAWLASVRGWWLA